MKLSGKWSVHCDMVKCDVDGSVAPDATPTRLWTCSTKPAGDYYGFSQFTHMLNSSEGIKEPLQSDSRSARRQGNAPA